jgi:PAS domain S-box-containing protein
MREKLFRANVLVVDDHPSNLAALEAVLEPLGHNLVKATSGEDALRQLLKDDFALVLLDVHMGGMSGFETAALMKQHVRSRHIPIIFISGLKLDSAHIFRGYSEGAVDYLLKPIQPEILRSKAKVFIDLYVQGETIKLQERMLREREREALERKLQIRYQTLIDSMPQCMWAARPGGEIYYWNQACLTYCGIDRKEATVETFWEVFHPDDREAVQATWGTALRERASFEAQFRMRRATDGAYRWHLGRAVAEKGEDGQIVGWIATATDIDDQKHAEEALQQAVRHRDEFLSVASHELRTPLTTLKLTAGTIARILQTNPERLNREELGKKVARLDAGVNRLDRLVALLLDVSRITSGRLELERDEVDLAAVIRDVCDHFREDAGAELRVQADGPVLGRWDRSRLDQLVTNLVSNAVKYGDGKPVDIALERASDAVARLVVRDHGIGIDPADHQRVFERFERASCARRFMGIGLGLWIVRQIAEAHGGAVRVDSALGQGASFTVDLPLGV